MLEKVANNSHAFTTKGNETYNCLIFPIEPSNSWFILRERERAVAEPEFFLGGH